MFYVCLCQVLRFQILSTKLNILKNVICWITNIRLLGCIFLPVEMKFSLIHNFIYYAVQVRRLWRRDQWEMHTYMIRVFILFTWNIKDKIYAFQKFNMCWYSINNNILCHEIYFPFYLLWPQCILIQIPMQIVITVLSGIVGNFKPIDNEWKRVSLNYLLMFIWFLMNYLPCLMLYCRL